MRLTWLLVMRGDAEGLDEILDPARRDTQDIGFLHDREQGPLGAPAGLEERGEVAAVTDPGMDSGRLPTLGIPAAFAVAVAVGAARSDSEPPGKTRRARSPRLP